MMAARGRTATVCPTRARWLGVPIPQPETLTAVSDAGAALPACRFCAAPLRHTFVDLGMSPLCESYVPADRVNAMEPFYPLHAKVCERCLLVQLEEFVTADHIFSEYAYFSSYSDSWVAHARAYVEMAIERFGLTAGSLVMEVASNDGYLLRHVVERGIPALGIEPAANVAEVARELGI
jgi:Putative zinc binding domain